MFRLLPLLSIVVTGLAFTSAYAGVIKKTESGFCHPVESRYYDRIDEFTPYNSLQACEASGGRLPGRLKNRIHELTLTSEPEVAAPDTSVWGSPETNPLRGQRNAMLQRLSLDDVEFADDGSGRVVGGRWISPYTMRSHDNPEGLSVAYVVPLAWAWGHGANTWSDHKRLQFASDPRNIWVVESGLNAKRDDQGPSTWLPPRGRCSYISRFVRLVFDYGLERTDSEIAEHSRVISRCNRLDLE